ncbi:hypothetical protein ILUMI_24197 [Ignelater luminosus]|uniref:Uncharacterized protein n=1 Tax=Ignelater luminosus TaxID=2038154 RepID=A0A8K0FYZ4_IGNLU|nr:hypothetical protein ILUMI_24197 [Ignelater luminosus]
MMEREIKQLVKQKTTAWKTFIQTMTQRDKEEYNTKRQEVKQAFKKTKRESWRRFGEEINEKYKVDNRKFWTKIKQLKGHKEIKIRA